jgi:DNA-directed RNA polymerase specialized sigma24 family protein
MQLSPTHVYYRGKSVQDASRTIGIALNTVKSRMFYARSWRELLNVHGIAATAA